MAGEKREGGRPVGRGVCILLCTVPTLAPDSLCGRCLQPYMNYAGKQPEPLPLCISNECCGYGG